MLGHKSACGGHLKQISDPGPFPSTPWIYSQLPSALEDVHSLGGPGSFFIGEQLPPLLEHFAAMPVGKTKMGSLDITANMLVFWTVLEGMIARMQVLVMKEVLHFPTNATQLLYCCLFFTLGEKRGNLTLGGFFFFSVFFRGREYKEVNS